MCNSWRQSLDIFKETSKSPWWKRIFLTRPWSPPAKKARIGRLSGDWLRSGGLRPPSGRTLISGKETSLVGRKPSETLALGGSGFGAKTIRLCLAKNVLANVHGISNAKELWEKLEALYQAKGHFKSVVHEGAVSHRLRMNEGSKISRSFEYTQWHHLELEAIGVKIEDEDKA
ncbi:hypothetical protein DH2020_001902 [Rehmannia glutinosa]|uniref:Uncharacterized protein n=1 Tax=Rehmannia glutinosa TaxID=99300 RepID=A0ABR0XSS8_REHGL